MTSFVPDAGLERYAVSPSDSWATFEGRSTLHGLKGKAVGLSGYVEANWNDDGTPGNDAGATDAPRYSGGESALGQRDVRPRDLEADRQQSVSAHRSGSCASCSAARGQTITRRAAT